MQGVTAVVLGNRRDPFGFVTLKIFGGQATTMCFGEFFNRMRNLTTVKRLAFTFGNSA